MKDLLERIRNGEILVGDGAMGTMLFNRGLQPGQPPEIFNIEGTKVLQEIAQSYLDAGADILETNTFGGTPIKLSLFSLDERADEINRNAVLAVKNIAKEKAYVSGSCGPTGRLLKPYGDTEPEEVYNSFLKQITTLVNAGVDIVCIETMIDLNEATLAVKASKSISTSIPVIATMTFDPTPRGFYTIMGTSIENAAKGLENAGADIIGSNCGNGIENMVKIGRTFKENSSLPIIIQSNAGLPIMEGTKTVYPETPEFMAEKARELINIGVSIIGGCCGTTPEHIRAIKGIVNAMQL